MLLNNFQKDGLAMCFRTQTQMYVKIVRRPREEPACNLIVLFQKDRGTKTYSIRLTSIHRTSSVTYTYLGTRILATHAQTHTKSILKCNDRRGHVVPIHDDVMWCVTGDWRLPFVRYVGSENSPATAATCYAVVSSQI